jgi:hypothetical protein
VTPGPPVPVFLHGFGARYDLPIPLTLYLYGAGAIVVLTFVLVGVFTRRDEGATEIRYPRLEAPWLARAANAPASWIVGGVIGVVALAAVVVTGLQGPSDPTRNPAVYLVWIYLWVGLLLLTALVGNVWTYLNPFSALARWGRRDGWRRLPERIGIWPAVAAFFGVAWLELASGVSSRPAVVAILALAYTAYTLAGMAVFGRAVWLSRCEAFTVLFGVAARFGPVETERAPDGTVERAWLRPWGVGLLAPVPAGWDRIVFVILMLSDLAFDGIEATPPWFTLTQSATPLYEAVGAAAGRVVLNTAGLVAVGLVFLGIFTLFVELMLVLGGARGGKLATRTAFAFTLVPIALVYAFAHYYTYLLVQGQGLIPLLADPLGRGWKLLPVGGFLPNWTLAQANVVWDAQVVLIVLGHVIAVYLAHVCARHRFRGAGRALLSQYPMLILMVAYTMTSLWILAQPITEGG